MVCTNVKVEAGGCPYRTGLPHSSGTEKPSVLQASQMCVSASTLPWGFVARLHYLSLDASWHLPSSSPGMELGSALCPEQHSYLLQGGTPANVKLITSVSPIRHCSDSTCTASGRHRGLGAFPVPLVIACQVTSPSSAGKGNARVGLWVLELPQGAREAPKVSRRLTLAQ